MDQIHRIIDLYYGRDKSLAEIARIEKREIFPPVRIQRRRLHRPGGIGDHEGGEPAFREEGEGEKPGIQRDDGGHPAYEGSTEGHGVPHMRQLPLHGAGAHSTAGV